MAEHSLLKRLVRLDLKIFEPSLGTGSLTVLIWGPAAGSYTHSSSSKRSVMDTFGETKRGLVTGLS